MIQRPENLRVLLVDDDEIDRMAVIRGFYKANIPSEIEVARDGVEGLSVLRGEHDDRGLKPPYLVLLDLNMPRLDGIGFLEEVRQDKDLRRNVIFILTTSDSDEDKVAAYERLVAGYIVKRTCGRDFQDLIKMLDTYWRVVALPQG